MLVLTSDQFIRGYSNHNLIEIVATQPVVEDSTGLSVYQVVLKYGGRMNLEYVSLDRNAVCDYTDTAIAWLFWHERLQGQGGLYPWYDELLCMSDEDFAKNVLDRCWNVM